jgi:GntR family transcriptional repressor for pyruvate dehydrogenase complex
MERFGVSRPTLREALRALESTGLLDVRRGSGGTYVRYPDTQHLADALALALRVDPARFGELWEARRGIEMEIAALAAERATATDLAALEASVRRQDEVLDDQGAFAIADVEFHLSLAAAAHNGVYQSLMESLRRPISEAIGELAEVPLLRRQGRSYHEALLTAVRKRDSDAARARMAEHFAVLSEAVQVLCLRWAKRPPADAARRATPAQ